MKISPEIKRYKLTVSTLNAQELLAVLNNSRLNKDERFAVELIDLYGKSIKEASNTMNTDMRQVNRWLHKARVKILKQIFK
jgi:DNA-directed RNA polymerase specialized sigma24 family protein